MKNNAAVNKQTVYLKTPVQNDGVVRIDGCSLKDGRVDELLEKSEGYFFTEQELLDFARKIAGEAWDACWAKTGDGWNGEIQPHGYMNDEDKGNYESEKSNHINNLKIEP